MLEIDRKQVMAYRMVAHQLDRDCANEPALSVLDLGVQDPRPGTALSALAARLPNQPTGAGLVATWTFRGAPHLHRKSDLRALNAELWPLDDTDAAARLGNSCAQLTKAEMPALQAIRDTATAWRETDDGSVRTKGEISGAVTGRLPDDYSGWCRGCGSTHVLEQLLRLAGLAAGAVIAEQGPPVAFGMQSRWPGPPKTAKGTGRLLEAYLRLHGPATAAEAAGYLGTTAAATAAEWPDGLAEVQVGRRRSYLPESEIETLRSAPAPRLVRLLPPYDPFLQARDRLTLVAEKARHKEVWRILGNPGALLVDGEVAGVWRAKAGKSRLTVTVSPFQPIAAGRRKEVAAEAERVAAVRGATAVEVTYAAPLG
ncbi:MAG TPA: crosslink repair DNA glycosylase YcaQ family protein [Mycobacteriales bacterium]|nr:crosslink repair DNA glycosylase YcaQ family protein [Mycobacteriales bacterium]